VDGVERDFNHLDPNEVESINVLKDASATAVFGVRGANGVIIITTKRGTEGKTNISIKSSVGSQIPTRMMTMANSFDYASAKNELDINDGVPANLLMFTPTVLNHFKNNTQPYHNTRLLCIEASVYFRQKDTT
jgi:TonB-dependent SusC/RagA subfamily outer membrane receptor